MVILSYQALACDETLKAFTRDCLIQDRYLQIKNRLMRHKYDINEIAEYRALRFIDRATWEWAKRNKVSPRLAYNPAPATWEVWDSGIRQIFSSPNMKHALDRQIILNENLLSQVNSMLLQNAQYNLKDAISDQSKKPGEYRVNQDAGVGFCWNTQQDNAALIKTSEQSMLNIQNRWESRAQKKLADLVDQRMTNKTTSLEPSFSSGMKVLPNGCSGTGFIRIEYSPSDQVMTRIGWILAFIRINLKMYNSGRAVLSPIELAVIAQKWFVSIHPFADGNGRTSRVLQDLILAHFDLPFAPAGDLQNDALMSVDNYIELTYSKIENMLNTLDACSKKIETEWAFGASPAECQVVPQINPNTLH